MNREVLAQIFSVLAFLPAVFIAVVTVRFFSQLARGEKPRVSEAQGLVWLACAWFGLVVGVALLVLVVLDRVTVLLPFGFAIVVVALFIASRAMGLLRSR
jgi:glucose uptake protein GlcU